MFYHPLSSSYHPHPLISSSFVILILYHLHPLSSSSLMIVILNHRYPLSFSSFIILKFILILLIILVVLFMPIILSIKQDVLAGRAAAGIKPGTFPPRRFLESPGAEQCHTHEAKFWGWDNSMKISPNVSKILRKLSTGGGPKIPEFHAKWGHHKIYFAKKPQEFYRVLLKKFPKF